jgi:hypothetical protein
MNIYEEQLLTAFPGTVRQFWKLMSRNGVLVRSVHESACDIIEQEKV